MGAYLAYKEMLRNRGRFLLFSMVIALITLLVLFIAGLGEGLGSGNKQYIEKLDADLLVFKAKVDYSIGTSKIERSKLNAIRRVEGVAEVGPISFSAASLVFDDNRKPLNVSLIGVEPGLPGEIPALQGQQLSGRRASEAVIDRNTAVRAKVGVGDTIRVKTIQAAKEEYYDLLVVGVSDARQYSLQPSVVVPMLTFEKIKPQAAAGPADAELISNVVAVRLLDPAAGAAMKLRLESEVSDIQAADLVTAYESTPGYSAQQGTLNTQRGFVLLIGVLVIGGFFQIQTLQKVAQIGMLKAIGTPNRTIAAASIIQIILVTAIGVAIGSAVTIGLSLVFPPTVPIAFTGPNVIVGIVSLLVIGPVGGLLSIRQALKVEPLMALGLAS
ncbi:MAG: ABC transporter permease [Anaerolineae bacterium]|uniref:ABC transporter permease n=1 Tax=Candidatus Amarolinea dominans TaxID=3140696 RepID=UPI003134AEDC|nr:ABC transporter permease [Anaerolineae bacterium]